MQNNILLYLSENTYLSLHNVESLVFPTSLHIYNKLLSLPSVPVHTGSLKIIDNSKEICLVHPLSFEFMNSLKSSEHSKERGMNSLKSSKHSKERGWTKQISFMNFLKSSEHLKERGVTKQISFELSIILFSTYLLCYRF